MFAFLFVLGHSHSLFYCVPQEKNLTDFSVIFLDFSVDVKAIFSCCLALPPFSMINLCHGASYALFLVHKDAAGLPKSF